MRRILAICRDHGQAPGWWDTLSHGEQVLLLAEATLPPLGGRDG